MKGSFYCIMAGEGWMHAHDITNCSGVVCFHHVLDEVMLVFFQPDIQLLVKLQVVETDGGLQGDKVDKLFLDGIGLQVHGILVNVGNLGNVTDLFNRRACGIIGLDMSIGVHHQSGLKDHSKGFNWVDLVIGSKGRRDFHVQDVCGHF